MVKKITQISVILLMIIIAVTFAVLKYTRVPIPFISKYQTKKVISSYLKDKNIKVSYDFKNNTYCTKYKDNRICSEVRGRVIYDHALSRDINKKAKDLYSKAYKNFGKELDFPHEIYVYTGLNSKNLNEKKQKLYLLVVKERKNYNENKSKERMVKIFFDVVKVLGSEFNITDLHMEYANLTGMYEIHVVSNKFSRITEEDLRENFKKVNDKKLPSDYFEWKKKK